MTVCFHISQTFFNQNYLYEKSICIYYFSCHFSRLRLLKKHDHHRTSNEDDDKEQDVSFAVHINTIRKAVDGCTIPVDATESSGL